RARVEVRLRSARPADPLPGGAAAAGGGDQADRVRERPGRHGAGGHGGDGRDSPVRKLTTKAQRTQRLTKEKAKRSILCLSFVRLCDLCAFVLSYNPALARQHSATAAHVSAPPLS